MSVTMTLNWLGDGVKAKAQRAVANAINATAADAVRVAQSVAPRDTGFMANTIEVIKEATDKNLQATWGNVTADYTLWVEIGARGRAGRYFLKQGADRAYPGLARRLKGAV